MYNATHEIGPDQRLVTQHTCIGAFQSQFGPPEFCLGLGQCYFGQREPNFGITQSLLLEALLRTPLGRFQIETAGRELGGARALLRRLHSGSIGAHALAEVTERAFVTRYLETVGRVDHASRCVVGKCDTALVTFSQQFETPLRDGLCRSCLHEPECRQPAIVPGICVDIVLEHGVTAPTCAVEYAFFPADFELFLGGSRTRITRGCCQLQQVLN